MPEYVLLASSASGLHLCDGGVDNSLGLRAHCDDSCVWQWQEAARRLENAASGAVVSVEPGGEAPPAPGSAEAAALDAQFGAGASLLVPQTYRLVDADRALEGLGGELLFAARDAPGRLPSVYMAELESQGWTVVDKIMSPAMVDNLVANITAVREANAEKEARVRAKQDLEPYSANGNAISPAQLGGRPGSPLSFLGMTPVVAQAAMHPVSLWLIESYLRVDDIHYCQVPAASCPLPRCFCPSPKPAQMVYTEKRNGCVPSQSRFDRCSLRLPLERALLRGVRCPRSRSCARQRRPATPRAWSRAAGTLVQTRPLAPAPLQLAADPLDGAWCRQIIRTR